MLKSITDWIIGQLLWGLSGDFSEFGPPQGEITDTQLWASGQVNDRSSASIMGEI